MTRRIGRAKQTIKDSRPGTMPSRSGARPAARRVLHVLYLIFNEAMPALRGRTWYAGLSAEAIRLARMVHRLLPKTSR